MNHGEASYTRFARCVCRTSFSAERGSVVGHHEARQQ